MGIIQVLATDKISTIGYETKNIKVINNDSMVIVVGCYAQLNPDKLCKDKNVDLVVGANEIGYLNSAVYLL